MSNEESVFEAKKYRPPQNIIVDQKYIPSQAERMKFTAIDNSYLETLGYPVTGEKDGRFAIFTYNLNPDVINLSGTTLDVDVCGIQVENWDNLIYSTYDGLPLSCNVDVMNAISAYQLGLWSVFAAQSGDWAVSATVTNAVSSYQLGDWSVSAEVTNAVSAYQLGDWSVSAEITQPVSSYQLGDWSVSAEVTNAVSAYQLGDWALSAEVTNAVSAHQLGDWSVSATVTNAVSSYQLGDWALSAEVTNAVSAHQLGDWSVSAAVTNAVSSYQLGTWLVSSINVETTDTNSVIAEDQTIPNTIWIASSSLAASSVYHPLNKPQLIEIDIQNKTDDSIFVLLSTANYQDTIDKGIEIFQSAFYSTKKIINNLTIATIASGDVRVIGHYWKTKTPLELKLNVTIPNQIFALGFDNGTGLQVDLDDDNGYQNVTNGTISASYESVGEKIVKIYGGACTRFFVSSGNDLLTEVLTIVPCFGLTSFEETFKDCINLTHIPDNIFANSCPVTSFRKTFNNCTSLTTIPNNLFKNNTLVVNFEGTFEGSGINNIPSDLFEHNILATNFTGTFNNCSNISNLPSTLFNTNTAIQTFSNIFSNCTNLTAITGLIFNNNINVVSFEESFMGCVALSSIPAGLFDNNILVDNFVGTFKDCVNLDQDARNTTSSAPFIWDREGEPGFPVSIDGTDFALNANATFRNCVPTSWGGAGNICSGPTLLKLNVASPGETFAMTFEGSLGMAVDMDDGTGLQTVDLGNQTITASYTAVGEKTVSINYGGFCDAIKITQGNELLTELITDVSEYNLSNFDGSFANCTNLTTIPSGIFKNNTNATSFNNTFLNCISLTSIPESLFDTNTNATEFNSTFNTCTGITNIPTNLFDNNTNTLSFSGTFANCTSLTSIPVGLFENNVNVDSFNSTFLNCTALSGSDSRDTTFEQPRIWERAGESGFPSTVDGTDFATNTPDEFRTCAPTEWGGGGTFCDGQLLVVGDFTTMTVSGVELSANRIAYLQQDYTLNPNFNASVDDGTVHAIIKTRDKSYIIGGSFTSVNGTPVNRIAKLNPDGSLDNTFIPPPDINNTIYALLELNDGRILVGGQMTLPEIGAFILSPTGELIDSLLPKPKGGAGTVYILNIKKINNKIFVMGNISFCTFNGIAYHGALEFDANTLAVNTNAFRTVIGSTVAFMFDITQQPNGRYLASYIATSNTSVIKRLNQTTYSQIDTSLFGNFTFGNARRVWTMLYEPQLQYLLLGSYGSVYAIPDTTRYANGLMVFNNFSDATTGAIPQAGQDINFQSNPGITDIRGDVYSIIKYKSNEYIMGGIYAGDFLNSTPTAYLTKFYLNTGAVDTAFPTVNNAVRKIIKA